MEQIPSEPSSLPPLCNYENSDYQTTFWEQGGREYEDQAEAIALKHLLPRQGQWLLEIGAGAGRNTPRYHAFQHIVLLDYSLTQLQQARARLSAADSPPLSSDGFARYIYVAANAYRLPFAPHSFDCVTTIRVLHHLADVPLAIQEIHRVMSNNGVLVMEFANKHNLKAILRYWLGKQTWNPFSLEPLEFVKLNFDFHPSWMEQQLTQNGFTIQEKRNVSSLRLGILKKVLPLSSLVHLDALLQPSGKWFQFAPSIFFRASALHHSASPSQSSSFLVFACPQCRTYPLTSTPTAYICPSCGHEWSIHDDIVDFRIG